MISNILKTGIGNSPEKIAVFDKDNTYSYKELDMKVGSLADGMKTVLQLKAGDVLAIQASNRIEFVWTLYACWRIGVSVTTLNPALKPDEIIHQLKDSNASVYIFEEYCRERAEIAVKKIGNNIVRVSLGKPEDEKEIHFEKLFSKKYFRSIEIASDRVALIIYTSGTTGKPKGVLLTHGNVMGMIQSAVKGFDVTESDRSYLIMPLFHVNSIHLTLSAPIYMGASVVLTNRFDPIEFLENVERYHPTYMVGVPTIFKMLADMPSEKIANYDLSSLKFGLCGGAPLTEIESRRFQEKYSFQFLEAWGLSEGTTCTTSNPLNGIKKIGSIGVPLPNQKVKVVNESGLEVPKGESGELVIQGEIVMMGYLNNPSATAEAIREGWLYTGDIGYEDNEGYFYIIGRKKDIIIRGGINIYPKQIEEVLYEIPNIREAAVIGIPDEKYGEEVVAYVSALDNNLTEAYIIEYCKEKMANYKCPVKVYVLESLPKNSIGKIVKNDLKKVFL